MKGLTSRQQELFHYIVEFIRLQKYSPSYQEIASHFGLRSLGTVYKHIQVLKRKGLLTSEIGCKRSIIPADNFKSVNNAEMELPFIGVISAGSPIETFPHSKMVVVPKYLVTRPEKTYVLQAKGDTLSEEFIMEGDLLLIEARRDAYPGETIVALINHHDTIVKRYYTEGPFVYLTGCNPNHKPITLRHEDIDIQGIVIGLIRRFHQVQAQNPQGF